MLSPRRSTHLVSPAHVDASNVDDALKLAPVGIGSPESAHADSDEASAIGGFQRVTGDFTARIC